MRLHRFELWTPALLKPTGSADQTRLSLSEQCSTRLSYSLIMRTGSDGCALKHYTRLSYSLIQKRRSNCFYKFSYSFESSSRVRIPWERSYLFIGRFIGITL